MIPNSLRARLILIILTPLLVIALVTAAWQFRNTTIRAAAITTVAGRGPPIACFSCASGFESARVRTPHHKPPTTRAASIKTLSQPRAGDEESEFMSQSDARGDPWRRRTNSQ